MKILLLIVFIAMGTVHHAQYHQNIPPFVKKVYDDMFSAMSNGRTLQPKLMGTSKAGRVASYWPNFPIGKEKAFLIDDQFIEIARGFGKDSANVVAHILGHELAHLFLQQNEFLKGIGSAYASTEYSKDVKKTLSKDRQKWLRDSIFEKQADEHSVFYAHIAGYKTTHVGALVLDSIYEKYGFEDKKLKSYPPLVKRKEIVSNSSNRMESLLILYEFGIASLLSKQFDLSIDLFEIIIEEGFQSKEVYNNLGLSYFQKALSLTPEDSLTYTYPFDMDFTSNLEQQRDFSPSEDEVKEFYKRSLECFDNALNIDKKYIKALTNKAILQFHTESVELPIVLAQLKVNAADTDSYKLLILLIDHKSGNINTSLDKMSEMAEYNSCASMNLSKIGKVKSVKKRALKNNEMIIKIYDHHDFLDRERGEEALENARAFRGNMVLTKRNIPMKLRILFDDEIYTLKWGNERRLFKIKSPKLINEITSGLTSSNNKSIDYIVFNEFVLKINYGEIQSCYIVL